MKNKINLQVPIIFIKENDAPYKAAVKNIDLGRSRLAIMYINENAFSNTFPAANTRTLAHEITHIQNNDIPILTIKPLTALIALSLAVTKLTDSFFAADRAHDLLIATILTATAGAIAYTIPKDPEQQYPCPYEISADKGSFEILRTLGYAKALEYEIKLYQDVINRYGADFRIRNKEYPSCRECLPWAQEAHAACIGINPVDRPDSQHLMRNGSCPQNNL